MPPDGATGLHRNPPSIPLLWPVVGLFGLLACASLFLAGPQVEADEGSYLLGAAMLAGRSVVAAVDYFAGYSALLLPAFAFSRDPETIYHAALLINALLIASIPVALFRLTSHLWPQLEPRIHARAAMVACCHAPVLMLSQFAMSDNALLVLYAWLLASCVSLLRGPRYSTGAALGGIAGSLFLVHPRGLAMAAPALVVLSLSAVKFPERRRPLAIAWLAMAAVSMLHGPLEKLAGTLASATGAGGYSLAAMLEHLITPTDWPWLASNLAGCTTDAIVASLGLIVVALRAAGSALRSDRWSPQSLVLGAAVVATVGALLITAVFFVPPQRADQLAYGRYVLPTLVPLIAIGLVRLQGTPERRKRDLLWIVGAATAGIAMTAFAYDHLPAAAKASWNYVNSPLLYLAQVALPHLTAWLAISVCFAGALSIFALALHRGATRACATFGLLNLAFFALLWFRVTYPGSRDTASDRDVVDAARALSASVAGGVCLTLEPGVDGWHRTDVGWRLFPQFANASPGCVRGSVRTMAGPRPEDMRLVAVERPSPLPASAPLALFVQDGPEVEAFARSHTLFAAALLEPVPPNDRSAEVVVLGPPQPLRATVGAPLDLRIRVTNQGRTPLATIDARITPHPVLAGAYAGIEGDDDQLNFRASLPHAVAPGESVETDLRVGPFDRAGRYAVHVGIVQEHIAWFDGGTDVSIEIAP
ncbi:MAG TPA: hypothetical protein VFS55_06560 [Dokdonella sp.]|nr:hypothetical protein [Dokdonella sp.]